MGKPGRRSSFRPLSDSDSLCDRYLDRRPPAQPADDSGPRARVRLQEMEGYESGEVACGASDILRDHRAGALRPRAGLHQNGPAVRASVCQRFRSLLQLRRTCLRPHSSCRVHLGHLCIAPPEERLPHAPELPARRHGERHAFHRLRLGDRLGAHHRARLLALLAL